MFGILVSVALTLVTNWLKAAYLAALSFTKLLSLFKSVVTVLSLSTSILSPLVFKSAF